MDVYFSSVAKRVAEELGCQLGQEVRGCGKEEKEGSGAESKGVRVACL